MAQRATAQMPASRFVLLWGIKGECKKSSPPIERVILPKPPCPMSKRLENVVCVLQVPQFVLQKVFLRRFRKLRDLVGPGRILVADPNEKLFRRCRP